MDRLLVAAVGLALGLAACVSPGEVDCGNGFVCAAGGVCVPLAGETLCVEKDAIAACNGIADGRSCTFGEVPSSCNGGACLAIVCGNSRVEPGEVCDDGNAVTGDGTCSSDCKSNETCGNGEVDPLVLVQGVRQPNEECDDGNLASGDGCSSRCATETAQWSQIGAPIGALHGAAMAYDAARHRMVLFGGEIGDTNAHFSDVTYEFDGQSWVQVPVLVSPPGRRDFGMAYDAARRRVVIFGGHTGDDNTPLRDMWSWDGTRWDRLLPATVPPARSGFGMVYDADAKRVVLFGGFTGAAQVADTWTWDGITWTELMTEPSPSDRYMFAMAYDPKRGVIVVAGGYRDGSMNQVPRDTWELSGSTWTKTGAKNPPQLDTGAGMAYDLASSRMLAFGGKTSATDATPASTTLSYNGTSWSSLADTTPGPRETFAMGSDPNTGTVLMFGGLAGTISPTVLGTTYRWNGIAWSAPAPRVSPDLVHAGVGYDPQHHRVWLFGGLNSGAQVTNTLLSFDGLGWQQHGWSGTTPTPRKMGATAYDRAREQLVVFGGVDQGGVDQDGAPLPDALVSGETWRWNGTSWNGAATTQSPGARFGAAMTYDPRRKVVVLFGGSMPIPSGWMILDDTWEWDGVNWKQIMTATNPPARGFGEMTYDEARGQVLMFNGFQIDTVAMTKLTAADDLWAYDGTNWTKVLGPNPVSDRFLSPIAYDYAARTSSVFGGQTFGGAVLGDTWSWNGTAWIDSLVPVRPGLRGGHSVIPSPTGSGIVIAGGKISDSTIAPDVWRFAFENSQRREICDVVTDNDGDGLQGCADPDCWSRCAPACPPGSTCDATAPHCGDGTCNTAVENCRICAQDCTCTAACGDTFCEGAETQATCPADCTP